MLLVLCLLAAAMGGGSVPRAEAPAADAVAAARLEATRLLGLALAGEPRVEAVQRAAEARAAPARDEAERWRTRARLAGLLPRLSAEYRHDERTYRAFGLSSGAEVDYVRSMPSDSISVRLGWELETLVFGKGDLEAASAAEHAASLRFAAAERATRLYYRRLRLRLALLAAPPGQGRARAEQELELDEVTAELDALTGLYGEGAP